MEKIIYQPPEAEKRAQHIHNIGFAELKRYVKQFWNWLKKTFENGTHRSSLIAHH